MFNLEIVSREYCIYLQLYCLQCSKDSSTRRNLNKITFEFCHYYIHTISRLNCLPTDKEKYCTFIIFLQIIIIVCTVVINTEILIYLYLHTEVFKRLIKNI